MLKFIDELYKWYDYNMHFCTFTLATSDYDYNIIQGFYTFYFSVIFNFYIRSIS